MHPIPTEISFLILSFLFPRTYPHSISSSLYAKHFVEAATEVSSILHAARISHLVRTSPRYQWNKRIFNRYCVSTPKRPTMSILQVFDRCGVDPSSSPLLLPEIDSTKKGYILYMGEEIFYIVDLY